MFQTKKSNSFSKTMIKIFLQISSVFFQLIKKVQLFIDTDEEDTFFFDLFGSYGLLNSIVTNDVDVFNKVIPGQFKQIFKKYNKISLLKWSFRPKNYEKLIQKQLDKFSPTARHFFKFIYDFGRHKKINNVVKVVTVDGNLQSFDTGFCGLFQMYLLNLFEPMAGSVVAESSSKNAM